MTVHTEIERKFLVEADRLPALTGGRRLVQAYLGVDPTVRVRLADDGSAWLTVKGRGLIERTEVETPIPAETAEALLQLRLEGSRAVEKIRHTLKDGDRTWEIDVFQGELKGLVLAEIELQSAAEELELPLWVGGEVSTDPAYQNLTMALRGMPVGE